MSAVANPQVTEFLLLSTEPKDIQQQELPDLREYAGRQPRTRTVLDDPGQRRKKYEIETGIGRDGVTRKPLEPWSCPVRGGMNVYGRIMHAEPGEYRLADLTRTQLLAVAWLREQQLASVGEAGEILPLSDARAPESRAYPGAPLSDAQVKARYSRYLRDLGRGLVLAAIANLSAGRSVRRSRKARKRELTADGLAITAAEVCSEANRIRSRRPDLAEFRYLSLSACRQLIRDLIGDGVLDELAPPTPARRRRSWMTLPRVIRPYISSVLDRLGLPHQERP